MQKLLSYLKAENCYIQPPRFHKINNDISHIKSMDHESGLDIYAVITD